jgi:hypothetical protein
MFEKKLDLDVLAFMLGFIDVLFYMVMSGDYFYFKSSKELYVPLVWVVGVVFPSVAAYVVGCWVFRKKEGLKPA